MPEGEPDLRKELQEALERNRRLEAQLEEGKVRIRYLEEQVQALIKRIYGSSSEKIDPGQLDLFGSGKQESSEGADAPEEDDAANAKKRNKKRRNRQKPRWPETLEAVIERVEIPDEVRANPEKFRFIGEEFSDIPDYIPGRLVLRRVVRMKFAEIDDPERPPLIVPAPAPPIPGVRCGSGLMALILFAKFVLHQPLYRQAYEFQVRYRVCLPRQTLDHWVLVGARRLLLVAKAVELEVLNAHCIQFDDTPLCYLEPGYGRTRRGAMWVYNDPAPGGSVCYCWHTSRGHGSPESFFVDVESGELRFRGHVQCDCHSAHVTLANKYPELEVVGCMAHMRRNFVQAMDLGEKRYSPIVVHLIGHLYAIETRLKKHKAGPALREAVRQCESRPILKRLHRILQIVQQRPLPESKLGQAIRYALNVWDKLELYVDDGRLEIDNNGAERSIRPTKLGMKNWLFIGRAECGWAAAVMYTLVENCKRQDLDPYQYLVDVFEQMPSGNEELTVEDVAHLTPARMANAKRGRWKDSAA